VSNLYLHDTIYIVVLGNFKKEVSLSHLARGVDVKPSHNQVQVITDTRLGSCIIKKTHHKVSPHCFPLKKNLGKIKIK
jgi:hypothetical protein